MSSIAPPEHGPVALDPEGLLCALVLAPATYSRNRFFSLYRDPAFYRVRKRALLLRGVLRQVLRPGDKELSIEPVEGGFELRLSIASIGFRRRTFLSPLERDLLDYVVGRATGRVDETIRNRVESALARLSGL